MPPPDDFTRIDALRRKLQQDRRAAITQLVESSSRHFMEDMKRSFRPYQGGTAGGINAAVGVGGLQLRSGQLRASIRSLVEREAMRATVYTSSRYAGIQETGGYIRPRRSRFLTIPMPEALTASGVLKGQYILRRFGTVFSPRKGGGSSSRKVYLTANGKLTFIREVNGKRFIFVKESEKRIRAIFMLAREVKLRPRLGWGRTFRAHVERFAGSARALAGGGSVSARG